MIDRLRVLQVCPRYHPYTGGIEEHVRNISKRLAIRYDVSVFTTDPSLGLRREEVVDGVKIKRFRSWAPNDSYYLSRELKLHLAKNSSNYDIVHAHSYHAFPALYAAQAKSRNELVFTPHYHGRGHTFFRDLLHIPYRSLGRHIFKKADRVICVSNFEKSLILNDFRIHEGKCVVVPNGVDLGEFQGIERNRRDCRAILCVGRLEKYKGVQYLIHTLRDTGHDIVLWIVGKGPYRESLAKLAEKLGVRNRVQFYEDLPRRELLQMYVDADLFVLLSRYEAYGISVAEALASGTACLVANTSALSEWIDNRNCYGIDDPTDLRALARLVSEIIRKRIDKISLPSWDEVVESLIRLYEGY